MIILDINKRDKIKGLMPVSNFFFRPSWVLENVVQKARRIYIYIAFGLATIIVFLKGLTKKAEIFTYFQNDELNQFLSFFSDPIVSLLITYIIFLGYIYLSFFIGRCFGTARPFEEYILSIICISFIGIIGHFISFILEDILLDQLRLVFFYGFFFWVCMWSLLAIKINFQLPISKAFLVFVLSLLPVLLLKGPLAICPYLSWLI